MPLLVRTWNVFHGNAVPPERRAFLDRVVQLHFAGGHWHDGSLIDSHGHPTPPEVWSVLEEAVMRAPVRGIILERDENLPPLAELLDELDRARAIGRRHGRWA